MKNKLPQKDYGTCKRNVQLLIDESFAEKVIPADDSVRLLNQMVEEMDLSPLKRAYDTHGRKPATEPSIMLKIVLYANMEGIYSSRSIQSSCRRDINFIWLLNGAPAPSYHEIARFRSQRLSQCAEELFFQMVKTLEGYGEIKFEHLFVDGTKIEANANKYSFVWKKSTTKYEARNDKKLKAAVEELSAKYGIITRDADELRAAPHNLARAICERFFVESRKKTAAILCVWQGLMTQSRRKRSAKRRRRHCAVLP